MTDLLLLLIAGYGIYWCFFRHRPDCGFGDIPRDMSHDVRNVSRKARKLPGKAASAVFNPVNEQGKTYKRHGKLKARVATLIFWVVVGAVVFNALMSYLATWA